MRRRPILTDQDDTVLLGVGYVKPGPRPGPDLAIGPFGAVNLADDDPEYDRDIDPELDRAVKPKKKPRGDTL